MNGLSRLVAIGLSACLLGLIFELVRRKKLKEKYAILWLCLGSVTLFFAVFNDVLKIITSSMGILLPINAVFFFGFIIMILINIHFSVVISKLSEQNKIMAQKLSLLEYKYQNG